MPICRRFNDFRGEKIVSFGQWHVRHCGLQCTWNSFSDNRSHGKLEYLTFTGALVFKWGFFLQFHQIAQWWPAALRATPAVTRLTVHCRSQVRMHLGFGAGLGSQLFVAWGSKNWCVWIISTFTWKTDVVSREVRQKWCRMVVSKWSAKFCVPRSTVTCTIKKCQKMMNNDEKWKNSFSFKIDLNVFEMKSQCFSNWFSTTNHQIIRFFFVFDENCETWQNLQRGNAIKLPIFNHVW